MKREIKTGQHNIQAWPVPDNLEKELKQWLIARARAYELRWIGRAHV